MNLTVYKVSKWSYLLTTKLGKYRGQLAAPRHPLTRKSFDPANSRHRPSDQRWPGSLVRKSVSRTFVTPVVISASSSASPASRTVSDSLATVVGIIAAAGGFRHQASRHRSRIRSIHWPPTTHARGAPPMGASRAKGCLCGRTARRAAGAASRLPPLRLLESTFMTAISQAQDLLLPSVGHKTCYWPLRGAGRWRSSTSINCP
jgi:hypothetical protein